MYTLHELFETLQGEGRHTGRPCIFIRFSGCNLACPWCDTDFSPRLHLTLDDILTRVEAFTARSIIFTGGEPLLQPELLPLAQALKARGYWLAIETNGTLEPSPELRATLDYIATSPKFNDPLNLTRADEVRLVVDDNITPDWCEAIRARLPATDYYLSPCDDGKRLHIHEAITLLGELNAECGMRNAEYDADASGKSPSIEEGGLSVEAPTGGRPFLEAGALPDHRELRSPLSALRSQKGSPREPWRLSLQTHKLAGIP